MACLARQSTEFGLALGTPSIRAYISPNQVSSTKEVPLIGVSIPSRWGGPSIEGHLVTQQLRVLISEATQALQDVEEQWAKLHKKGEYAI